MFVRESTWDGWHFKNIDWLGTFVVYFLIAAVSFGLYALAAGFTVLARPSQRVWFSSSDYLHAMGLDVNRRYRLRLGTPSNGSYGKINSTLEVDFFLFSGNAKSTTSGEINPSSAVKLSFTSPDGTSYIPEIPYGKVRFRQDVNSPNESWLKFVVEDHYLDYELRRNVGADYWTFDTGEVEADRTDITHTPVWHRVTTEGVPNFLNKSLAWVEFHLTPQQYDAYLGSLQRTSK